MIQITRTSNSGPASGEVPITFKRVKDHLGTFFRVVVEEIKACSNFL